VKEAPLFEGTRTKAPLVEGTCTEAPLVEGTCTEAPLVEGTRTEASLVEGDCHKKKRFRLATNKSAIDMQVQSALNAPRRIDNYYF